MAESANCEKRSGSVSLTPLFIAPRLRGPNAMFDYDIDVEETPADVCLTWATTTINTDVFDLPACPCTAQQASNDGRFIPSYFGDILRPRLCYRLQSIAAFGEYTGTLVCVTEYSKK